MAKPIAEDDVEAPPVPGHRNYLVYCDESGIDGQVYYGFGSLWLPWERRGDLVGFVNELMAEDFPGFLVIDVGVGPRGGADGRGGHGVRQPASSYG